jgi:hypothetical protein
MKFGFMLSEKHGHGDIRGVGFERGKLEGAEHVEGGGEAFEDKEYPNSLQSFLVKFSRADFDHEAEGFPEGIDALLHVAFNKCDVVEFLHHIGGIFH